MTMWIPNDIVGQFIGQRGSNINRIIERTKVFISVQKEDTAVSMGDLSGGLLMRPVILTGDISTVLEAQKMAMEILQDKLHQEMPGQEMGFAMVAVPHAPEEPAA